MRTISATILDATHLELSQPLTAAPGEVIQITLPEPHDQDERTAWLQAGKQHMLAAYNDEDAAYDEL